MCTRYCPWCPIFGTRKSEVKLTGGVEMGRRAPEHSRQAESRGRRRRVSGDGAIGEREACANTVGLAPEAGIDCVTATEFHKPLKTLSGIPLLGISLANLV